MRGWKYFDTSQGSRFRVVQLHRQGLSTSTSVGKHFVKDYDINMELNYEYNKKSQLESVFIEINSLELFILRTPL